MTPRWLANWDEAGRRRADRLAGRPVVRSSLPSAESSHVWLEEWAPVPSDRPVDRSVHMRPAETQHFREAVADRVDSAIARSVRWLLSRSGLGR